MAAVGAEIRRLEFRPIFGRIFDLVRRRWIGLLVFGLICVVLPEELFGVMRITGLIRPEESALDSFRGAPGENLALGVAGVFLSGAIAHFGVGHWNGANPKVAVSLTEASSRFGAGLGIRILYYLAVIIGTVLLIAPGIFVALVWCVAWPAAVMEGAGVTDSFSRSAELTRNNRWMILGAAMVFFLVAAIGILLLGVVAGIPLVFASESVSDLITELVLGPLSAMLASVAIAVFTASLYFGLKAAREGMGDQRLAEVFA